MSDEGAKESADLDRRTNRDRLPHSTTRSEDCPTVTLWESGVISQPVPAWLRSCLALGLVPAWPHRDYPAL